MHPLTTMTLSLIPSVCLAAGIAIGASERPAPPNTYRYFYQSIDNSAPALTITSKGRPVFHRHYDRDREARRLVDLARQIAAEQCWGLTCLGAAFQLVPPNGVVLCHSCWWSAEPPLPITEQAL